MGNVTALRPQDSLVSRASANPERAAILEQLERILATPLFTNSKRYPGLLRYVVERALDDPESDLKERTIGIEVFGREPSYDTNHDPVVRTSAVEVRKRLIQYYQDPAHEGELRIELVVGSYVPRFQFAPVAPVTLQTVVVPPAPVRETTQSLGSLPKILIPAAVLAIAALLVWLHPWASPSAVDSFWEPVWATSEPLLIGLSGGPGAQTANDATLSDLFRARTEYVPMGDVAAMAHIIANLKARNKPFSISYNSDVKLENLKSGPSILIGPMSRWLELMASQLRFTIRRDQPVTQSWVSDKQHPERRDWSVQVAAPASSVSEAYGLISRVWDPMTGKFMVCISGLSPYATSAAGEFVSDPNRMKELFQSAPSGWEKRNVQIVIAATRVGTNVGTPRAVATYFW